jgi:hypothetical protein
MIHFCTLFDSNYLNRGLVMYRSLKEHCPGFHLYIFPFDETARHLLENLNLEGVTLVSLNDFETSELLEVKKTRTKGEYCWTCTSFTIDYCLTKFSLPECTYLDSDLFFFDNPQILIDEMRDKSILITEHRYTPKYDQSSTSGLYCVQFITFRNNVEGRTALTWWKNRCLEWCFARFENGKFGDQKYLDDWTTRFSGVHVLSHLGGGVAPWNVQQYNLYKDNSSWFLIEKSSKRSCKIIFYHFHYIKFFQDGTVNLGDIYNLGFGKVLKLYREYLIQIDQVNKELAQGSNFMPRFSERIQRSKLYKAGKKIYNWYLRTHGLYNNINLSAFISNKVY